MYLLSGQRQHIILSHEIARMTAGYRLLLAGLAPSWLAGRLAGWLAGWPCLLGSAGWLAGWLAGCELGWLGWLGWTLARLTLLLAGCWLAAGWLG